MTLLRPKVLIFVLVATIFLLIFWPTSYQHNQCTDKGSQDIFPIFNNNNSPGPVIDAIRTTTITDTKGTQKEYLNAKGYITFLHIIRKQHKTAIGSLTRAADLAVANDTVYSVTLKPQKPPSGDIHDYMSLGRYFWPDPTKPDGLPYIRKDGYVNPEFFTVLDYVYMRKMFRDVQDLGFAYFFTRNETYVEKAMYRIKEWFLDEETKMNPNLNYAGFRKGQVMGWRTGVLDFHQVFRMLQAIPLMRFSNKWDPSIEEGLKEWLSEYYVWFTTSKLGRGESKTKNNHGTFYDVQALFLLDYLGRYEEAKSFIKTSMENRVNNGILPTGQQPHETDRPTSWFYSIFNLQGLFMLAERADHYDYDAWNYVGPEGQSIRKAVDFLLPFALNEGEGWPVTNIKGFEVNDYVKILELSYVIWGDEKYLNAIEELRPKAKAEQAAGLKLAKWEDNYLCDLALLTNRLLWTCLY
ncbi:6723_t:CDS:1 [Funneliformis caledonium]|uniref:6723_t:CDS:1 n=1 Tax=Funneliformis caledonium TaxID=1117310 RepID=A0A9N9C447_9GLOM|nr:6723_t:CDS:1 [Funneliformis caledonium]